MAIAERINYFRNKCGMTMKHLGQRLGYAEKSADVRVAQYEAGNRKPKEDTIHALAEIFDVAPAALDVPDIDSYIGIMHTLFVLEDQYDLSADLIDGEPVLRFGTDIKKRDFLWDLFTSWPQKQADTALARSPKRITTPGVITIRNSTRGISGRKSRRI
jgi:transcriptional regulator with XRE-family HTH domain